MKTQTLILISITASLVLSLAVTLATYNVITYPTDIILDAAWIHRGWPLYWMIESWSFWSPPPYPHHFTFQPMNFLADLIFYAIILQIPMQICMYSKRRQKTEASTPTMPHLQEGSSSQRTAGADNPRGKKSFMTRYYPSR